MYCSAEKPFSRQSSLDSASGRRPAVTKQSSADDWLGLGDEKPIESGAPLNASKAKPSPGMIHAYISKHDTKLSERCNQCCEILTNWLSKKIQNSIVKLLDGFF